MTSTFRIPILLKTMREIVVALIMIKSQVKNLVHYNKERK